VGTVEVPLYGVACETTISSLNRPCHGTNGYTPFCQSGQHNCPFDLLGTKHDLIADIGIVSLAPTIVAAPSSATCCVSVKDPALLEKAKGGNNIKVRAKKIGSSYTAPAIEVTR